MNRLNLMMLLFFGLGGLAACNTTQGLGEDVEALGEEIEETAEETEDEM